MRYYIPSTRSQKEWPESGSEVGFISDQACDKTFQLLWWIKKGSINIYITKYFGPFLEMLVAL